MSLSKSALAADQAALTATADNISNQNTAGYTRRAVNWSSGDTVSVRGADTSTGVTAMVVAQRDRVLQRSVQTATEAASASSTRVTALNNLQSLFALDSDGNEGSGIVAAMGDFFNAASAYGDAPGDSTAVQTMVMSAQTLANAMNRTSSQLAAQTSSLNQTITSSIAQVNTLAATVASLNKQISETNVGDDTDSLTDQRDLAVTQLSKLIDVNSITGSNGSVSLALSNGAPLVTGSTALPLQTGTVNGVTQIYASPSAGGANVTAAIHGGSIGGSLQVRDSDIPAVVSQLNQLATTIISSVNAQNAASMNPSGTGGGSIFSGSSAATMAVTSNAAVVIGDFAHASNGAAIGALQSSSLISGNTLSGAFSTLISSLGTTAANATTGSTADAAVLTQTTTQMDAVSGVSLDTEAANLTQFQRSYEAAAKVLSIVNELMAQAINLGTETAVS